jgi:hypothetical protein
MKEEAARPMLSDDELRERIMSDPEVQRRIDEVLAWLKTDPPIRGMTEAEVRELLLGGA